MNDVRTRVYRVVAEVLDVPVDALCDEAGPDTLQAWDSASHLNLVMALESEFGIAFSDQDVTDMLSIGLIRRVLADHGVDESGG